MKCRYCLVVDHLLAALGLIIIIIIIILIIRNLYSVIMPLGGLWLIE